MTKQSTAEQSKTSHLSHQPKPVFASQKLAGFAEPNQSMWLPQCETQTRSRNYNSRITKYVIYP